MKKWIIYKHTSPSGKCYIGITCKSPNKRWSNGKGYPLKTQSKMYRAIQKYGWDNFTHEIIEDNIKSLEEAKRLEKYYIALYDSFHNGYNMTEGGEGTLGRKVSEETKRRMSKNMKGRYVGEKHPRYGKHWDEEHKQKQRQRMLGKYIGEKNPNYGNKGSKNPISKPILQYDLNGNFIREWGSIAEANEFFGKKISHRAIIKENTTSFGYQWKYKNSNKKISTYLKIANHKVLQYDLNGNFIKEWDSITEANRYYNTKAISPASRSKSGICVNYIWRRYEENYPTKIIPYKKIHYKCKTVIQYDLNGKFIRKWISAKEAIKYYKKVSIYNVLIGRRKTACGYIWKYEQDVKTLTNEQKLR